jgi:hypothetical protein
LRLARAGWNLSRVVEPVTSGDGWVALGQVPGTGEHRLVDDRARTGAVGGPGHRREPMGKNSSPDGSYYTEENRVPSVRHGSP